MPLLLLSLAALLAGPLLHGAARRHLRSLALLDGFTVVAILGLTLLHALPESIHGAGLWAVVAAIVGFAAPTATERLLEHGHHATHRIMRFVVIAGLTLHGLLDGMALASESTPLAVAVCVHRLAVSLTIWTLVLDNAPTSRRILALLAIGLLTLIGFFGSRDWLFLLEPRLVGLSQALVSGALMHLVLHRRTSSTTPAPLKWHAGLGGLFGIGTLIALQGASTPADSHAAFSVGETFVALSAESAPALLLAYLGAGALAAFMPAATVHWLDRGPALLQTLKGMTFGLPLPVCSCGVVPLYRSLIQRGAPPAAALAFLVATPEIGIDAALLSWPLLGPQLTLGRITCAAIVAVIVGVVVGRFAPPSPKSSGAASEQNGPASLAQKLRYAVRAGLGDVVDNTAPWILLGLFVAAVGSKAIQPEWSQRLPAGLDVLMFAVLGIPTYVCASGATPLVAMLVAAGISPGAALAFLLTGPASNISTFGILRDLHGSKVAISFGLAVGGIAIGLGYGLNLVIADPAVFPINAAHHAHISPLKWCALAILGLIYATSLLRQGPRSMLAKIFHIADHDHSHGQHHHAPGEPCTHQADQANIQAGRGSSGSCCHGP